MGRERALRPDCFFTGEYQEGDERLQGDPEFPNKTVGSIDIGTVNFAADKVTLVVTPGTEGKEWRVILEGACALTLKGDDPKAPIETIVRNLYLKMNGPQMDWFWDPKGECDIYVERQVDHIQAIAAKKNHPGKATMHAVYAAVQMLELTRQKPLLSMPKERIEALGIPAEEYLSDMRRQSCFVPVSGHKKAGLRGIHGNDRKNKTGDIMEEMLAAEGQTAALRWFNRLARHKPREDVADAYLQARRELEDFHQKRLKERRMQERAIRAAEKQEAKESRKRKRETSAPFTSSKKQKISSIET